MTAKATATKAANKFPGRCVDCRGRVEPDRGYLLGKEDASGRRRVRCHACEAKAQLPPPPPDQEAGRRAREREEARRQAERREEARRAIREREWARARELLVVLGLEPPVCVDQIRARFRDLARQLHPDRGGDARRFIEARKAYEEVIAIAGRELG